MKIFGTFHRLFQTKQMDQQQRRDEYSCPYLHWKLGPASWHVPKDLIQPFTTVILGINTISRTGLNRERKHQQYKWKLYVVLTPNELVVIIFERVDTVLLLLLLETAAVSIFGEWKIHWIANTN